MNNMTKKDIGMILVLLNGFIALGIGFILFGVLAAIFGIHIWNISISLGIVLLVFIICFIIEKLMKLKF